MPSLHTSRNFIIHSIPYVAEIEGTKTTNIEECNTPAVDILKILAVSNSFMNGSLAPEVFQNFTIVIEDFAFPNIVSKFSSTLQFTNKLSLRKMLHHEMHPYFHFENKEWKVVKTQAMVPFLPAQFLTRLITTTRYFARQLTSFDFYSINDCYSAIFRDCLPRLRALRHLKIKFPIRHNVGDERSRGEAPHEDFPHDRKDHELYPERVLTVSESEEEIKDDPIVSVVDYECRSGVKHCTSHGQTYKMLSVDEIVCGLANLHNLDSLDLTFSREIQEGSLQAIWKANPMPHLKKLSLTVFPHSIDDYIVSDSYPDDDEEMDYFTYNRIDFDAISRFQPGLESLTLRRMQGTMYGDMFTSPRVDYRYMNSLKELSISGLFEPNSFISIMSSIDANRVQFCHQLIKLSIGGFSVVYEADDDGRVFELEPRNINSFLYSISSIGLKELDLRMPSTTMTEAWKLEKLLNDKTLETIVKAFPLLESLRILIPSEMTNNAFQWLGDFGYELKTLNIASVDAFDLENGDISHFVDDAAMSFLFDPKKCTGGCYATLEELTIDSSWFHGEGWFGKDALVPQKHHFRVRRLDFSGMRNLWLYDHDGGGLTQILFAFSECLEELHLPYHGFEDLCEETLDEIQEEESFSSILAVTMTRLRTLFYSAKREPKKFVVADRPSVYGVLFEALAIRIAIEKEKK